MNYREMKFPNGKVIFMQTGPSMGRSIEVRWMVYHPKEYPKTLARERRFSGFAPRCDFPFATVWPPTFIGRWFGVTHESKIKKQVEKAYRKVARELKVVKYQNAVRA